MSNTVLEVNNLRVRYSNMEKATSIAVVSNVSFKLERGEILGIVGESGAGKSTVGHAIMAALKTNGEYKGDILLDGKNISMLDKEAQRKMRGNNIAVITQDPFSSLNPILTIGMHFAEMLDKESYDAATTSHVLKGFRFKKGFSEEEKKRIFRALDEVDLPSSEEFLNRYPFQISGGQSQRVIIALALLLEPKVLIADEPTTALDVFVQEQILNLMKKLVQQYNMAMILITHNMGVVYKTTDKILVMKDAMPVEEQVPEKLFTSPKQEYTRNLIRSLPPKDYTAKTLYGSRNWDTPEEEHVIKLLGLPIKDERKIQDNKIILECKNITFKVPVKKTVVKSTSKNIIDDVSFYLKEGKSLGLIGESGSGKSTLAKLIVGLNHRPSGIFYEEKELGQKEINTDIQMVFQSPYSSLNPRKTLKNIWAESIKIKNSNISNTEIERKCKYLLDLVGLPSYSLDKYPQAFSGGQLQRICIARVLILSPKVILCDEPTSALDISVQADILNLLKYLQEECNITMLFISHDLPVVRYMCDDIAVLKDGKIVEIQDRESLFNSPKDIYTSGLIDKIPSTPALT